MMMKNIKIISRNRGRTIKRWNNGQVSNSGGGIEKALKWKSLREKKLNQKEKKL